MNSKIFYNETNYNEAEIKSVVKVLKKSKHSLVGGNNTKDFEIQVSKMFGKKYGLFVNSGSSAILLALAALNLPKNSEIITPSLTFSTTISPILQMGLVPKLIDIEIDNELVSDWLINNNYAFRYDGGTKKSWSEHLENNE